VIRDRIIICFASNWDYHPTSKHHVMRKLSEHNYVIWVNWHASRRPRLGMADLRTIGQKLREIGRGARQATDRIIVITPPQIPMPGSSLARQLNVRLVCRAIRHVLANLPSLPVQLWTFAPDMVDLVGRFNEELVLYYCVDAFAEFPGYDRDVTEACERRLLALSDVVLATSPPLYESRRRLHHNVHFVQHGVDHARLSRAVKEPLQMPEPLRLLPRPIYGFVGIIGDWVDVELIAALAQRRPTGSVVLIGPENTSRGSCADLPNVHWLGPRSHAELPAYLRYFDVGLIPFRQQPLTHNANPIKLYEYLAAGVPVVSTNMPAVDPIPGSVWVADDIESLVAGCDEAIRCNSPEQRLHRSNLMLSESWDARVEQISRLVDQACDAGIASARIESDNAEAEAVEHEAVAV